MGTALLLFFLHFTDDDVDDGVCVVWGGVFKKKYNCVVHEFFFKIKRINLKSIQ